MCWKKEEVNESQGPRVPGSKEPRYLKVTFKYELDSKEGPSSYSFFCNIYTTLWNGARKWGSTSKKLLIYLLSYINCIFKTYVSFSKEISSIDYSVKTWIL